MSSTFGFTGWRWDEDQYLRPLTDQILSSSLSPIVDFTFVTSAKFLTLFNQVFSARSNDELMKHFPILAWGRDEQLRLIDMDSAFRKVWYDSMRLKQKDQPDLLNSAVISKSLPSSAGLFRQKQQSNENNTNRMRIESIEDESNDIEDSDSDDNPFSDINSSRTNSVELIENGNDHDLSYM